MGTKKDMKQSLIQCKEYSGTIMNSIGDLLEKREITYNINSSKTEIVIKESSKSKKDIKKMIEKSKILPGNCIKLLLDFTEVETTIIIRLKFK